jgi:hypothetical protein
MGQVYSRAALFSTITRRARVKLAGSGLAALAALLALVLGAAGPAAAVFDTQLVVTVSDDPDPAASGGQVNYTVLVKADGPTKAKPKNSMATASS